MLRCIIGVVVLLSCRKNLEEKQLREQLYAAVMALPEKQAKRLYARYYLGMRVSEIAAAEGVDPSRVRDSIRRGLKQLAKYF